MIHKLMRAVDRAAGDLGSITRIARFRMLYPGLSIGREVVLQRGVRLRVLNGATLKIGDRTVVQANAEIHSDGHLTIGNDAFIGAGSMIVAAERIAIGNDALVAERVTIRDQDHRTGRSDMPYRSQGKATSPILIGNNVWLGAGVVVLKGAEIGDHCVVGANAVVIGSLASGTRAAGAPARPIR